MTFTNPTLATFERGTSQETQATMTTTRGQVTLIMSSIFPKESKALIQVPVCFYGGFNGSIYLSLAPYSWFHVPMEMQAHLHGCPPSTIVKPGCRWRPKTCARLDRLSANHWLSLFRWASWWKESTIANQNLRTVKCGKRDSRSGAMPCRSLALFAGD